MRFCSLFSGSSGNCLFAEVDGTRLLIDAGVSGKRIVTALASIGESPDNIDGILISHEHSDHVSGAGVMSRKYDIPIYANYKTWAEMEKSVGKIAGHNIKYFETEREERIGNFIVCAFPIPHDASEPVGFNLFGNGKKVSVATDLGHISKAVLSRLENSDLILLESNHDVNMLMVGPYPYPLKKRIAGDRGHLSNENAAKMVEHLVRNGTRRFILGHLSKENNYPDLAYLTARNILDSLKGVITGEVELEIAYRDCVGRVFAV